MDRAAALNNDPSKTIYPYIKQLPLLNSALQELQELFELNDVPVTATVSTEVTVLSGTTEIGFAPDVPVVNTPYLPSDLVEPRVLWERQAGIDPYIPMTKLDTLPRWQQGVEVQQLIWYTWQTQKIKFLSANQDNDIKMDYIKFLFAQFTSTTGADNISVINSRGFLEYRTGALVAEMLGENPTRAQSLNGNAVLALDRIVGIGSKGRQNIMIRRRPFRSSFKRRTYS